MLIVDRRTSFSLSPILRGMFFNELPLRDCTSFESSDRGKITRFRWEPTKAADAKGWAQWGRNIAWKNLDSSAGKDIDRFRDQKGSRITINYTWFEKISGRFLSLETEENSPREFDGKCPLDDKYFIATASILFHKRKFFCFYVIIIHIYLNMNRYVLNVLVKKKKKTFHSSLILKSLYVNRYTSIA